MEIKKFFGLNNKVSPERMNPGELATAVDIDIDNTRRVLSRRGMAVKNATSSHSLFSGDSVAVVVASGALNIVNADFTYTAAKTLISNQPLSYDTLYGVIYYSNGIDKGRLVDGAWSCWGVDIPVGQPVASKTTGSLPPGTYLYALTFLREDGHESGTGVSGSITVGANSGIDFSGIEASSNAEVTFKNLYVSSPNGEVQYLIDTIPNAQTTYSYRGTGLEQSIPLATQHAGPPPAGTIVRIYNGMAYVLVDDTIYYSDPYNLELFRLDRNFLRFQAPVANFDSVNTGLYVSTVDTEGDDAETLGASWYLTGSRPDQMRSQQLFDYGSIPNTCVKTDASYFKTAQIDVEEPANPSLIWATRHGVVVAYDGGLAENLTESHYSYPIAQRGAAMVRRTRGYTQYIATLQGSGDADSAYSESIT